MQNDPHTVAHPIGPAAIDPPLRLVPMSGVRARAGFPSPAEDYLDDTVDLNEWLIRNQAATFYYRAEGWSMLMAGICDGDILVVDRSVTPIDGDIVLAVWEGQMVCKVLKVCTDHIELHSRNPHCKDIVLDAGAEVEVFAVTGVARQIVRRQGRVRAAGR